MTRSHFAPAAAASSSNLPPSPLNVRVASPPTYEAAHKFSEVGFDAVVQTRRSLRELLETYAEYAAEYAILEPLLLSKLVVYRVDRERRKAFFKAHPVPVDGEPAPGLHLWQSGAQMRDYATLYTCVTCTNRVPAQKESVIESIVADHGTEAQKQAWTDLLAKKNSSFVDDEVMEESPHEASEPKPARRKRRRASSAEESSGEAAAASTSNKHRRTRNKQVAPLRTIDDDEDDQGDQGDEGDAEAEEDPTDRRALATKKSADGYLFDGVWYHRTTHYVGPWQEVDELHRRGYRRWKPVVANLQGAPDAEKLLPFIARMGKRRDNSESAAAAAAAPEVDDESKSFALFGDRVSLYGCKACMLVTAQVPLGLLKSFKNPWDVHCVYFQPMSSALLDHIRRDHAHLSAPKTISRALKRRLDHCKQDLLEALTQTRARFFNHAVCEDDFGGSKEEKSAWMDDYLWKIKEVFSSEPIDLLIVLQRVILRCYSSVDEVVADAQRVFDNAKLYNRKEWNAYRDAVELEADLMPKLKEIAQREEEEKRNKQPPAAEATPAAPTAAPASAAADTPVTIPSEAVDKANEPFGMEIDSSPSTIAAAASSNLPAGTGTPSSATLAPASVPVPPASASVPVLPPLAPVGAPLPGTIAPLVERLNSEVTKCLIEMHERCEERIRELCEMNEARIHALHVRYEEKEHNLLMEVSTLREEVRERDETIRDLRDKARTFYESIQARGAHGAEIRPFHEERRALDEAHAEEIRRLREAHEVERVGLTQTIDNLERTNAYLHTRLDEVKSQLATATTVIEHHERKENGAEDAPRVVLKKESHSRV